ncbi:MAG: bifunctional oligoribonuclease/PAP phosphatase NrnA [Bacilli bacterium]|nr:bifunctional oligoribonuclease/PAP phosphatase NrnA [Bacilli bacterium]
MFNEIYKRIKEYDNIVIARHIGVDPDALCSSLALRDSIKLTFPNKNVIAVGSGSQKFNKVGSIDKYTTLDDALLIVLDTPDKKRVDTAIVDLFKYKIKIDHHPFIEKFCDIEYIDDNKSSTCEIIMELLKKVDLECNETIAGLLFLGVASDSNRFLFNTCTSNTFKLVSEYMDKYNFDLEELYPKIYSRPMNEVRLQGYISLNMKITDNGVGYAIIDNDTQVEYKVDSAAAGNMINNFNFIEEAPIWVTVTEDVRNAFFRISVRSRGITVNKVCEKYNGGGHIHAAGARVKNLDEAMNLINDLDKLLGEMKNDN